MMTRALTHRKTTLRATVSRLLVALVLVLFGAPQSFADETMTHAGPAAESQIQQSDGILTVQRHLLRGPLSEDTPQDLTMPGASIPVRSPRITAIAPASLLSFVPLAISILPPVRGPPAF
jgi:hypothetical protein